MPFLAPGHVTWHSAFLVPASGEAARHRRARTTRRPSRRPGAYERVEGYVEGVKEPLLAALRELDPSVDRRQLLRGQRGLRRPDPRDVPDAAARPRARSGTSDRLVPAERIVSALRARKTPTELARIKEADPADRGDLRRGRPLPRARAAPSATSPDWSTGRVARARAGAGLGGRHVPGRLHRPRHGRRALRARPTRPVEPRPHRQHGLRREVRGLLRRPAAHLLRPARPARRAAPRRGRSAASTRSCARSRRRGRRCGPGVPGRDVDAVARGIVTGAGYDEFPHALGHQVGRFAHDGTALLGPAWEKYAQAAVRADRGRAWSSRSSRA